MTNVLDVVVEYDFDKARRLHQFLCDKNCPNLKDSLLDKAMDGILNIQYAYRISITDKNRYRYREWLHKFETNVTISVEELYHKYYGGSTRL
jgi:hypothetical protein